MSVKTSAKVWSGAVLVFFLILFPPRAAHAYLDPGTSGSIYQIGYFLFYAVLGFLAVFFKQVKYFFAAMRKRLFGPKD